MRSWAAQKPEAEEKHRYLQSLIHPDVGIELLQTALGGFKLSGYPLLMGRCRRLPSIPRSKSGTDLGTQCAQLGDARRD